MLQSTPVPAGRSSVTLNPVAVVTLLLARVTVKPICEPAFTLAGSAGLVPLRSGGGVAVGVGVGVAVEVGVEGGVAVAVAVAVGVGVGVAVAVAVAVAVGVGVGVGVATNTQLVLLPESTLFVPTALIAVALMLFESWTSRNAMVRTLCGSIFH